MRVRCGPRSAPRDPAATVATWAWPGEGFERRVGGLRQAPLRFQCPVAFASAQLLHRRPVGIHSAARDALGAGRRVPIPTASHAVGALPRSVLCAVRVWLQRVAGDTGIGVSLPRLARVALVLRVAEADRRKPRLSWPPPALAVITALSWAATNVGQLRCGVNIAHSHHQQPSDAERHGRLVVSAGIG